MTPPEEAAGAEQTRADMAAPRAACQRQIAAGRDRLACSSAVFRAGLHSARSAAREALSRQEDLAGLEKQLRDLEADLAQSLSLKLAKESKCERARESVSTSAAASEQLRNLVAGQRSRRDQHAAVVSRLLQAVKALEIKDSEDEQWRKDIDKALFWYQKFLGFRVIVGGEGVVKFIFDKVDLQIPEKEFSVSLKFDKDTLTQCGQSLEDSEELLKDLNLTNDLTKFVRITRQRLQAALVNGTLPISTTVFPDASPLPISSPVVMSVDSRSRNDADQSCSQSSLPVSTTVFPDASPLPISSPVIMSVDSRSRNDADQSRSQSKNKKQALPAKRRASARLTASPGSVRRSPRFPGNG